MKASNLKLLLDLCTSEDTDDRGLSTAKRHMNDYPHDNPGLDALIRQDCIRLFTDGSLQLTEKGLAFVMHLTRIEIRSNFDYPEPSSNK